MTSQPQPSPGEGRSAVQILRPLRDLAAYALVAATGVLLFVAFLQLIPFGDGLTFTSRAVDGFDGFVNLATIVFPIAAVLLALLVRPQMPNARMITVIALVEYAVAAFFAVVFGVFIALVQIAQSSGLGAFEALLTRAAWLAVFAVPAVATFQIWRHLFTAPKAAPSVYSQPQYGGPYAPPPGYGPPPAYGQQTPVYGQPPIYGQPAPHAPQSGPPQSGPPQGAAPGGFAQQGPPAGYGQPQPPPAYPGVPPGSAPPPGTWGQPPVSAQPAPPGPYTPEHGYSGDEHDDATRIVPPSTAADRPGFGPAEPEQPGY